VARPLATHDPTKPKPSPYQGAIRCELSQSQSAKLVIAVLAVRAKSSVPHSALPSDGVFQPYLGGPSSAAKRRFWQFGRAVVANLGGASDSALADTQEACCLGCAMPQRCDAARSLRFSDAVDFASRRRRILTFYVLVPAHTLFAVLPLRASLVHFLGLSSPPHGPG
jgi:hypothetical protein